MNTELKALYTSKWDKLTEELNLIVNNDEFAIKPTNPLLLTVDNEEAYKSADLKVMVFGQETNDWGENFSKDLESKLTGYTDFFHNGGCWKHGGHFWNGVRRLKSLLEAKYEGKKIHLLWNNVLKIGKSKVKGQSPEHIYKIEKEFFQLIPDELAILKPDLVVFFSGRYYDWILRDIFKQIEFVPIQNFQEHQIARLNIDNIQSAYRTYHPNYLWRKRDRMNDYLKAIIEDFDLQNSMQERINR